MQQGLRVGIMAEGDEFTCGEWKEKYMALETLLFKFRGQMTVIRELTAEKVSARRPRPPGLLRLL